MSSEFENETLNPGDSAVAYVRGHYYNGTVVEVLDGGERVRFSYYTALRREKREAIVPRGNIDAGVCFF